MELKDTYCYMVGAYYGIEEMDNYELKEFVLKDIENYICAFVHDNALTNKFDLVKEANQVKEDLSLKTKLQDSLLLLPKVGATLELILLVKAKLKEIREEELEKL